MPAAPALPTLPPMAQDSPELRPVMAALAAEEDRHAAADPLPRWSPALRQPQVIPANVENPTPRPIVQPAAEAPAAPAIPPYPFAPIRPAGDGDAVARTVALLNRVEVSRLLKPGAYDVLLELQACRDLLVEELLTRPAPKTA